MMMNGWAIAYLVFMAIGMGATITRHSIGNGTIKITFWDIIIGPAITLFLLYKAGLFSA